MYFGISKCSFFENQQKTGTKPIFHDGWMKIRKRLAKNPVTLRKPEKDWQKKTIFPKVYKLSTIDKICF